MAQADNFSHAATILPVVDVQRSVIFYTEKLGFDLTFSWEEPMTYAVLKRGGVSIHLTERGDHNTPSAQHCILYIFVYDIERIYEHCLQEEVEIKNSLGERDYAMKDFDIVDPDGYIITFGKGG